MSELKNHKKHSPAGDGIQKLISAETESFEEISKDNEEDDFKDMQTKAPGTVSDDFEIISPETTKEPSAEEDAQSQNSDGDSYINLAPGYQSFTGR